jgi:hypothetical protein
VRLASGLLVLFAAFGFGAWFSGLASWVAFYLGARGTALTGIAQAAAVVGVAAAVVGQLAWFRRRCRRGRADIPAIAVWAACLALPVGNISWAIFVDAIAWHYGQDIVRPAFDIAIMYVVLGGTLPRPSACRSSSPAWQPVPSARSHRTDGSNGLTAR